jgi:hypothetical protein
MHFSDISKSFKAGGYVLTSSSHNKHGGMVITYKSNNYIIVLEDIPLTPPGESGYKVFVARNN